MIKIRKATTEDEAKIFDLLKVLFPSSETPSERPVDWPMAAITFREIVKNDEKGVVLLAEEDGDAFGVITLSYPVAIRCGGKYACIQEFIVSEQARGKGVGGQLLEAAIAEATSKGCYELHVSKPSELGYPLYIRHGLKDISENMRMKLPRKAAADTP